MSHAHNIDSALSTAALQATRYAAAGPNRAYSVVPITPMFSRALPAILQRMPQRPFLHQDSPLLDIACGSVAGITSKFIEHPFDTIKVRLQSQSITAPIYNGTLDCIKKSCNAATLYQGICSPLIGAVGENAILFLSYSFALSFIAPEKPTLGAQALAGAFSGGCVSFLLTPVELLKCRVQVNGGSSAFMLKSILASDGILGLYRGYSGTFLRESVGGAAWFGTYEYTNARLQNPLLSGACAGIAFNAALFPADVIKSIQQTQSTRASLTSIAKSLWKSSGIKGLYRGFGITAARAGPSSAMIFWTYEGIKSWMTTK